jgi:hypothetical protein
MKQVFGDPKVSAYDPKVGRDPLFEKHWFKSLSEIEGIYIYREIQRFVSSDKYDLLWINLLQTRLKRIFSITHKLNF